MKTFQETLIRNAFEGNWPPWSTAEEVAGYFATKEVPPPMRRAYEIGLAYRGKGEQLTTEERAELDSLSPHEGFYARWDKEVRREQEMKEAWDRALGQVQ